MRAPIMFALALGSACGSSATPQAPLLALSGDFSPDVAWPELALQPHIRCDGSAVLVPLETVYGGERSPVQAAILDRTGRRMRTIDLDAVTGFDHRLETEVRRRIAEENDRLQRECWRPLAVATDISATWSPPVIHLSRRGHAMDARPDYAVPDQVPDTDCPSNEIARAVFVDDATSLGVVRIEHEMHDNCGSSPPTWFVVPLRFASDGTFACGLPSRAAFDELITRIEDAQQTLGACSIRRTGDHMWIYSGEELVYSHKDGGASWGYTPAFVVDGVRPGADAEAVADLFARKGWTLKCSHDDEGTWCTFGGAVTDECNRETVTVRLRPSAHRPSADHPSQLRGHVVAAVALGMPC